MMIISRKGAGDNKQMRGEKVDLRIVKTRKAIKAAFISLLMTKGYERMTIQNIADEALINRNTFYLHYVDKVALMDALCAESLAQLNVCVQLDIANVAHLEQGVFRSLFEDTFRVIETDFSFYKAMLSERGYPPFVIQLKAAFKKVMLEGLAKIVAVAQISVALEYMVAGLVGVICLWVTQPQTLKLEAMIEQLSELHCHNILKVLGRL